MIPWTLIYALLEHDPRAFLATQVYLAESLKDIWDIISVATPVFDSKVICISLDVINSIPSLYHFTVGIGLPLLNNHS